jgi:hypothetical protein
MEEWNNGGMMGKEATRNFSRLILKTNHTLDFKL